MNNLKDIIKTHELSLDECTNCDKKSFFIKIYTLEDYEELNIQILKDDKIGAINRNCWAEDYESGEYIEEYIRSFSEYNCMYVKALYKNDNTRYYAIGTSPRVFDYKYPTYEFKKDNRLSLI